MAFKGLRGALKGSKGPPRGPEGALQGGPKFHYIPYKLCSYSLGPIWIDPARTEVELESSGGPLGVETYAENKIMNKGP